MIGSSRGFYLDRGTTALSAPMAINNARYRATCARFPKIVKSERYSQTIEARALSAMSKWKKALLALGLIALWACGLVVVGNQGYPSQYFWGSVAVTAIGFAVAPFWRLRASIWYWPAVALLGIANLAALYIERAYVSDPELPSKGVVQAILVVDCMASWSFMVIVCWLFSRRFPWQLPEQ